MAATPVEVQWLTEDHEFSLGELEDLSGLSEDELRELVAYGAITPVDPDAARWTFKGGCLVTIRTACRLRVGFDLDLHAVALVVSLLDRIHDLEAQLGRLRAQLPHRIGRGP